MKENERKYHINQSRGTPLSVPIPCALKLITEAYESLTSTNDPNRDPLEKYILELQKPHTDQIIFSYEKKLDNEPIDKNRLKELIEINKTILSQSLEKQLSEIKYYLITQKDDRKENNITRNKTYTINTMNPKLYNTQIKKENFKELAKELKLDASYKK